MQSLFPNVPEFMQDEKSPFWAVVINVVFIFPLALQRNLSSLRYVCLIGFFFVMYVVIVIVVETFNSKICDYQTNWNDLEYFKLSGIFNTWSMSLFAFQCHQNVLDVYLELNIREPKTMNKVMKLNNLICFLCYVLVGFFGYLTFANDPEQLENGNILQADYKGIIPILIAILLIGLQLIPALPLVVKPSKDGLLGLLYPDCDIDSTLKHFILTSTIMVTQVIASLYIPNMATILTWLGGTTSGFINMTFPCMFYLIAHNKEKLTARRLFCHVLNVFSVIFCIATVISFLINGTN